jgi:hypothetical protein
MSLIHGLRRRLVGVRNVQLQPPVTLWATPVERGHDGCRDPYKTAADNIRLIGTRATTSSAS